MLAARKSLDKVIWAEGMLLAPQHFQCWDSYYEQLLMQQLQNIAPFGWGFKHLLIEEAALLNGKLRVLQCQLIFPNRRLIQYDSQWHPPLVCDLKIHNSVNTINIYLCILMNDMVSGIAGYPKSNGLYSWEGKYLEVPDLYDAQRVQELLMASPKLFLLQEEELKSDYYAVKLAKLNYLGAGNFQLAEHYIPPVIHLSANQFLISLNHRLIEKLQFKLRYLEGANPCLFKQQHAASGSEIVWYLMTQALMLGLAALSHLKKHSFLHPEQFYKALVDLIVKIRPFIDMASVAEIPDYDHQDLQMVFTQLERLTDQILDGLTLPDNNCLPLVREGETLWVAEISEKNFTYQKNLVLSVKLENREEDWLKRFLKQIKIGSRTGINTIINSALSGIKLKPLIRLPPTMQLEFDRDYFLLESTGYFWEQVIEEGNVAIFCVPEFIKVKLELFLILKN